MFRFASKVAALAAGSAAQVASLAILSLLVAKFLSVEQFGVTRSVVAYMVILTMIGHFTLHDAVASYAASSKTKAEAVSNVMHGVILVLIISSATAASFSLFVQSSGYWSGDIRTALATVVLVLPFESLGLVFLSMQ